MAKQILINGAVLTMDQDYSLYINGYVRVHNDRIAAVGPMAEIEGQSLEGYKVIDCKGGIVMPGMINTHGHIPMSVFRSLGDSINDRLRRYIFPLEAEAVDGPMVYAGSLFSCADMIMGGTTCAYSAYFYSEDVARAVEKSGMRGVVAETLMNFPCPGVSEPYGGYEVTEKFMKAYQGNRLVIPSMFAHAPYTVEGVHIKRLRDMAKDYDCLYSMHLAEMPFEYEECLEKYNMSPVAYVNSLGVLDEKFLAAHVIDGSHEDIQILAGKGAKVAHNPKANTKGGKGIAPVHAMRQAGVTVGLGTDGPMSGNTLDVLGTMNIASFMQRTNNRDASIFNGKEMLTMATIDGARCLGLEKELGSLETGKKADIIMFETESLNMNPIFDYYSVIAFSANAGNVVLTMVDGEILMENRRLKSMDVKEVKSLFNEQVERVRGFAAGIDAKMAGESR